MKRYRVSNPYHGESYSLWYIVDNETGDPIDSARSYEAALILSARYEALIR